MTRYTLTIQNEGADVVERPAFTAGYAERPAWRRCVAGWTLRLPFGGPVVLAGLPSLDSARAWRRRLEADYHWQDAVGTDWLEGRPLLVAARADATVREATGKTGSSGQPAAAVWPTGAEDERVWNLVDLLLPVTSGWHLVLPGRFDVPVARELAAEYLARRLRAGAAVRAGDGRVWVGAIDGRGAGAVPLGLVGTAAARRGTGAFHLVRRETATIPSVREFAAA